MNPPEKPHIIPHHSLPEDDHLNTQHFETESARIYSPEIKIHQSIKTASQQNQSDQVQKESEILSKEDLKKYHIEGILCVFGGFCLHLMMGTFYMWGGISGYIASYFAMYDPNASSIDMAGVFPYMGMLFYGTTTFGTLLSRKIGGTPVIFIGVISMTSALIISSFLKSQAPFVAIYTCLCGLSIGLMYMVPLTSGWSYFPLNKGLVSGICVGGFGFGSLVFTMVCQSIVNPNNATADIIKYQGGVKNTYFEPCIANQVPKMFRILVGVYVLLGTTGLLFIRTCKVNLALHYQKVDELKAQHGDTKKIIIHSRNDNECKSLVQGLKSRPFIILFLCGFLCMFFAMGLSGYYKKYGMENINDDGFLSICGSIGSAFNGSSRIGWAMLYDKFGFKKVFTILLIIQASVSVSITAVANNKVAYFIWVCISYTVLGGFCGTFPPVFSKIFGPKVGPIIYGFVMPMFGLGNLVFFLLVKYYLNDLQYSGIFWIGFAFTLVALFLSFFLNEKHKWNVDPNQKQKKY